MEDQNVVVNWTDERVIQLRDLWNKGRSASQIAKEMGNVTRNAVIGKVHRLGLSGRPKTLQSDLRGESEKPAASALSPSHGGTKSLAGSISSGNKIRSSEKIHGDESLVPFKRPEFVASKGKTILELTEHTCKWPIGDPGNENFHFCGHGSCAGLPYCDHHARMAYQPVHARRKERYPVSVS